MTPKLYFAHAMCLYGTEEERLELRRIRSAFPRAKVINPGTFESELSVEQSSDMSLHLQRVRDCDVLVFSRILRRVTSGVGKEVNLAISIGTPVYELKPGKVVRVRRKVRYVSRRETVALYDRWRDTHPRGRKRGEVGLP